MFGASPFEDYLVPQTEKTTLYWDDEDETQPDTIANEQDLSTDLASIIVASIFLSIYTRRGWS
jgi:hypothetical protein